MLTSAEIEAVHAACAEAGAAVVALRAGSEDLAAEHKADRSPVSTADYRAAEIIERGLERLDRDLPVVSEEGSHSAHGARRFWLVDPLDGTREYLRGSSNFSINVALIDDGFPVFGMVFMPVGGTAFWGGGAVGAWCDGARIRARKLSERRLLRVLASPSEGDELLARLSALEDRFASLRVERLAGAVKFCRLAAGDGDLYPRLVPSCGWDTAAGQAVLEGAGGAVLDAQCARMRYSPERNWGNACFVAVADAAAGWAARLFLRPA